MELIQIPTTKKANDESASWLNAKLTEELPPYDWGPSGPPKGKPIIYRPGVGFVVQEVSKGGY